MKKIIIALLAAAILTAGGAILANNDNNGNDNIKPNISDVPKGDLKQKIQIDETSAGNLAWITGAKITEISGPSTSTPNLIKVKVFGQDYKISVEAGTNVVRQYWGKSEINLSEFSVGDIVNIYGILDSSDYFLIHAKTVRNVSIQKMHAVVSGTISSIASSAGSFVIDTRKAGTSTVNVKTDANTKIYSGNKVKSFSDLKTGAKVTVRGTWDKTKSYIQALLVRMNPFEVNKEEVEH
jgi:hypothetical protein